MKERRTIAPLNYWALGLGALLAVIPSIGLFAKLGDPGHWPIQLGFGALGLAVLIRTWKTSGSFRISVPAILWFGLTVWAWAAPWLTELYSVAEWKYSAGRYTGYAGVLLLGGLWARERSSSAQNFSTFLLGFGGILSLHYVLTFLAEGADALTDPYLVPGLLGHKNFTASAIALTLPVVVLGRKRGTWPSHLADGVLILGMLAILLTQTRSIWLGGALALGVGIGLGWRPDTHLRYVLFAGMALVGLFALSGPVQKRLLDPANLEVRQIFWDHSFQMQSENPIGGVGPGQWRIHFPKYGLSGMNPSVAEGVTSEVRPHNDFLWILAEQGVVGLVLFVGFFLWIVGQAVQAYRSEKGALEHTTWLAVISLTLVYASFEFPLERAAFWIPFLVLVGLNSRGGWPISRKMGAGIAAIALGTSTWISWKAIEADQANQVVLEQNSRKDAQGIIQSATEARTAWNELDRFSNPLIYFAGMGSLFGEAQTKGPNPIFSTQDFKQAEAYFNEALQVHPYHVVTLYQKANMHRYRREFGKAKTTYAALLAISPRHPGGQVHYAVSLNALGEHEAAARVLISAFLSPEFYASPEYQHAVVEAIRGMPAHTPHNGLKRFVSLRGTAGDEALLEAFQKFKNQRWQQERAG